MKKQVRSTGNGLRVRITAGKKPDSVRVTEVKSGEELRNVTGIKFEARAEESHRVTLELTLTGIDLVCNVDELEAYVLPNGKRYRLVPVNEPVVPETARKTVAAEREACAKLAENAYCMRTDGNEIQMGIARAIRARDKALPEPPQNRSVREGTLPPDPAACDQTPETKVRMRTIFTPSGGGDPAASAEPQSIKDED